jgi:hypothetical protein
LTGMHVCPSSRHPTDHQVWADKAYPDEHALRFDGSTPRTRAVRNMTSRLRLMPVPGFDGARQDDTSDSQLIARWRSRARSPMSMPVVVAICSIGVLMRSSGE